MREAKLIKSDIRIGSNPRGEGTWSGSSPHRQTQKFKDSDAEEKDFHLLALLDENDFVGYERPLDTKEGSVT